MKRGHQQKLIDGDEYDIMAPPKHQYTNKNSASIKFTESDIKHEATHFVLEHNGRPADPNHVDNIGINYYWK